MLEGRKTPSISVIVPVYNVENWLAKCINSILLQSFRNFELLLIDDGSSDNSSKICKKFLSKDDRVKYFYKKNGGLSDARNYGLKKATGRYVVFIDSDDYIKKDYLYLLFNSIESTNSDVAVCGFEWVDKEGEVIYNVPISNIEQHQIISGKNLLRDVFKHEGYAFVVVWNKIYKKELFDHIKFDVGRLYEDEFINFKLFWNVQKVSIVNQKLYCYVQRDGSIKNSKISEKKIIDFNKLHEERTSFYKENDEALYVMANKSYRKWIVSTLGKYAPILPPELKSNMKQEYRKLKMDDLKLAKPNSSNIRILLAYFELPVSVWIRKIIYTLKKEK